MENVPINTQESTLKGIDSYATMICEYFNFYNESKSHIEHKSQRKF